MNQENISELGPVATGFLNAVKDDPRAGPTHISLFMAILQAAGGQDVNAAISVFSRDLMKQAKIASIATYRKCIHDLQEMRFINYEPSYNPLFGSLIHLLTKTPDE
jgi:hypothetical protein